MPGTVTSTWRGGYRDHDPAMRPLVLLTLAVGLSAATATAFDGRTVHGTLTPVGNDRIRIGTTELVLRDIDTLALGEGAAARSEGDFGILLRDGSWLPARSIAAAARPDHLSVACPFGTVELPLEIVVGWGDPEPPAATDSGDAVLVESGLLGGRLLGLRDGVLRFASALDPEPLALPITAVRAARLALAISRPQGLRLRLHTSPQHPPLDLVIVADGVALAAAPAVRLDTAMLGGTPLRIEGGRRSYLSDLQPATVHEDGMFGVVWPHARNAAIGGGPLLLHGTRFGKGLTVHSVASLGWRLDTGTDRLRAQVGIADQVTPEGDCVAVIRGDGRELWRARVRGGEMPRSLDLALTGVTTLELRVEAGERYDIGDHLVLADAQLIGR